MSDSILVEGAAVALAVMGWITVVVAVSALLRAFERSAADENGRTGPDK